MIFCARSYIPIVNRFELFRFELFRRNNKRGNALKNPFKFFFSKLSNAVTKLIQGYLLKFLRFQSKISVNGKSLDGSALIRAQSKASAFYKYRWHQFMLGPVIGSVMYLIVIMFLNDDREHMAEVERLLKEKRGELETVPAATEE